MNFACAVAILLLSRRMQRRLEEGWAMYDLAKLKMSDTIRCGIDIRALGRDARTMEEAAQRS